MTEFRLRRAISTNLPPSARLALHPDHPVRAYSETAKLWLPDFTVVLADGKDIWLNDGVRVVQLHRSQVLPDYPPTDVSTGIKELSSKFRPFHTHPYPTVLSTEVLSPS